MDGDWWFDNTRIVDSTPGPYAMPRPSAQRSELAGFASHGYCASHSRYVWGLRLYLVCTPSGTPILYALANAKLGEREVLAAMLEVDADLITQRDGNLLISDKGSSRWHGEPMPKKVLGTGSFARSESDAVGRPRRACPDRACAQDRGVPA